MDTAWLLVAHKSGAQIFEKRGRDLSLLREIPHDEGRLQDRELGAGGPGRDVERQGKGRHALGRERQRAIESENMRFIRQLAGLLEDGRVHNRFSKLVLVAEPRFLGEMRAALTPETGALISTTQGKDLAWMDTQAIKEYLQDITWPPPRQH